MAKEKVKKKRDLKTLILGTPAGNATSEQNEHYPDGTQSLVPIRDIKSGVVITDGGRYIKILEVLPTNFYLKSSLEQLNIINSLAGYLKIAPVSLQFTVVTQSADIDAYCEQMEAYYNIEHNENCREMILEDARLVNYIAENEALTRRFYIIFAYEGNSTNFDIIAKELADTAYTAYQYLDYCGLEVIDHKNYDEFLLKTIYSAYHKATARNTDFKVLLKDITAVHGSEEISPEELSADGEKGMLSLKDILSPDTAVLTNKEYVVIEDVYHSYLFVTGYGYPTEEGLAWLAPLVELGDGVSLSFYLNKQPKEQILKKVSKTTMLNRSRMRDVEDTRTDFEEMDDAVSSGMHIKEQMNREGEEFYYMHTLIEITAHDTEILFKRIRDVKNKCTSIGLTVRKADYCHEQCFMSMLPLCTLDADISAKSRRNVLTTAAAASFPFSSFELCDDKGILMGINLHNDSAVILDNFNSEKYSNGNMAIFGMTGAGKTYTILLMAMRLRMCGVQVFIIAPEKGFEYRSACEALGGQYIKLARGSVDCINIMDIRRTSMDIDENLNGPATRNDSVLLDTIQDIRTYFKLRYPEMTAEEGYLLNSALMDCYASFGITKENESILNPDGSFKRMPTLRNLYSYVEKIPELRNVSVVLKDLIDSGFGGKTNVDLKSSFIVMDTSSSRDEDIAAVTYMATVFIRDEMSKSRTRKKAVFGDELWVIAGKEGNERAADFVIKLVKTIRGYGGIFISATQNVIDYFALRDGKFGDSILNNSRLKLLLQMEQPEALKLQEKLGLSDSEVSQIISCNRGQGLLCAGKNRIAVEIRSSSAQYDLITTNRADLEKRVKGEK